MKLKSLVIFTCLFLFTGAVLFAQTKMISHKSHSGDIESLNMDGEDNFGNPPVRIDSVRKLSDTSIIEYGREFGFFTDTAYHHPVFNNPNISLDSLKKMYPRMKFIGFDQKPTQRIKQEQQITPIYKNPGNNGGPGTLLLIVLAFSGLIAFISWKTQAAKEVQTGIR